MEQSFRGDGVSCVRNGAGELSPSSPLEIFRISFRRKLEFSSVNFFSLPLLLLLFPSHVSLTRPLTPLIRITWLVGSIFFFFSSFFLSYLSFHSRKNLCVDRGIEMVIFFFLSFFFLLMIHDEYLLRKPCFSHVRRTLQPLDIGLASPGVNSLSIFLHRLPLEVSAWFLFDWLIAWWNSFFCVCVCVCVL